MTNEFLLCDEVSEVVVVLAELLALLAAVVLVDGTPDFVGVPVDVLDGVAGEFDDTVAMFVAASLAAIALVELGDEAISDCLLSPPTPPPPMLVSDV